MHRYEPSTPRVAFGIAAVAMTAITIGVLVVMPAKMQSDGHASMGTTLASASADTDTKVEVATGLATTPCPQFKPNCKPED